MSDPYRTHFDGEWRPIVKTGYRAACCDCGLVHVLDFRVDADGEISIRVTRDDAATSIERRSKAIPIV
jgi:hypothetical protein